MGLLPRGSTLSGSVAPSWPPSPPSSRCGSPSRSTTSLVPPLSTESASKFPPHYQQLFHILFFFLQKDNIFSLLSFLVELHLCTLTAFLSAKENKNCTVLRCTHPMVCDHQRRE